MLEAYRMFAYDRGWLHKLEEAVTTGLTAEAAVERVQSDTARACCAPPTPICASGCTISTTSPTA